MQHGIKLQSQQQQQNITRHDSQAVLPGDELVLVKPSFPQLLHVVLVGSGPNSILLQIREGAFDCSNGWRGNAGA
jgi:hypothetical protein